MKTPTLKEDVVNKAAELASKELQEIRKKNVPKTVTGLENDINELKGDLSNLYQYIIVLFPYIMLFRVSLLLQSRVYSSNPKCVSSY